jgi:hypothetical protein
VSGAALYCSTSIPLALEFTAESLDQSIDEHAHHRPSGIHTAASPERSSVDLSFFIQIYTCEPFHTTSTYTEQSAKHGK